MEIEAGIGTQRKIDIDKDRQGQRGRVKD